MGLLKIFNTSEKIKNRTDMGKPLNGNFERLKGLGKGIVSGLVGYLNWCEKQGHRYAVKYADVQEVSPYELRFPVLEIPVCLKYKLLSNCETTGIGHLFVTWIELDEDDKEVHHPVPIWKPGTEEEADFFTVTVNDTTLRAGRNSNEIRGIGNTPDNDDFKDYFWKAILDRISGMAIEIPLGGE